MKKVVSSAICLFLIQASPALAGEKTHMNATIKIEKLTLFKNGLGFVTATARLPENAKDVRIGQLPVPSFGTFWISYPESLDLVSLVTFMETSETRVPARSLAELLRLNPGRKARVFVNERVVDGAVIVEEGDAANPARRSPYVMGPRESGDRWDPSAPRPPSASSPIVIKTEQGAVALEAASITRVDFADRSLARTALVKSQSPSIRMKLNRPSAGQTVTITFLARGFTWAPGYLADLSDPESARFSAHAVVINEAADLEDVALELVTGFPNIKFGEVMSPVAKTQSLAEFIQALAAGGSERASNVMTQQVMLNQAAAYDDHSGAASLAYSTAAEGTAAEDLFFYPVKGLTLGRDETAWLPLFSADMPYKHVYTWQIGDTLDRHDDYRAGRTSPEEVWHACRLSNTLSLPLTTAAVEFMTDGRFTGQDVCPYTPAGAKTTIRINKALNVPAEQVEIEVARKRDAVTIHGYRYDAVTLRGELRIKNNTGRAIDVEITKELSGEVIENAERAKDVKTEKGLRQVNPGHRLTWEIKLKAGENRLLTYRYQTFLRN